MFLLYPTMEYENALGVFSPDGRLIQVEYAQQASEQGSLVVFSKDEEKVVISFEVRAFNNMLVEHNKLEIVDNDTKIWYTYSGLKPDSYKILKYARVMCRNYKIETGEDISLERLAYEISLYKHKYTIDSSLRPFGIRSVLIQVDVEPIIYIVEPDGNYSKYNGGAVGNKSVKICDYLEKSNNSDVVYKSVSVLGKIVQSDKNKVRAYILDKQGCKEVSQEVINEIIKTVSV